MIVDIQIYKMYNQGTRQVATENKNEIFQWMFSLSPEQVKDVLTIRDQNNLKLITRFLYRKEKESIISTKQVSQSGFRFCERDADPIFRRQHYKIKLYSGQQKIKNQRVQQLAESLCHNLSISRSQPHEVSIKRSFLKEIENCMEEISKHCLFLYASLGDQTHKSLWFKTENISSLAEWIVYMMECQIKIKYANHKKNMKNKKKQKIKGLYQFIKQRYPTQQCLRQVVIKVVMNDFLADQIPKSQNYENKKNFLLNKCMDRIKQEYDQYQYLIEYNWFNQNITNDNYKILSKICSYLKDEYKEWAKYRAIDQIFQDEQKEKQEKLNKKKRKKQKLKAKAQKQLSYQKQQQGHLAQIMQEKQSKSQIYQNEQKHTQILINQKKEQHEIEGTFSETEINETEITEINEIENEIPSRWEQIQINDDATQSHKKYAKSEKQERQKFVNKKIIKQRINEYYSLFTNQLAQAASSFDKYRKITWGLICNFIQTEIISPREQKIEQQSIKTWKLQVYGSACAGFSLKHSDLDLVFLTNNPKITLNEIFYKLKFKQWAIDCKFIQAQIPIITVKVSLSNIHSIKKQLSSKQYKKIQGQLLSVDLTLAPLNQPHSGIQNTKQLKDIFQTYPTIRNICILLKEYLRVRKLNKPYTGGIGSYVLIIMIHGILTRKNILGPKQDQKSDEYKMIKQISNFMEDQFQPFETVISSKKSCKIKADQTIHLNIVNPVTDELLKTSAFHIINIINQFKRLREFQQTVEKELQNMKMNEKKNMKNHFVKAFNEFLYGKYL